MTYQPGSRELSQRVEVGFHRRPNFRRRRMWVLSALISTAAVLWLVVAGAREDYRIYESGSLATVHKSLENNCTQCHTTWAPFQRFVLFDNSIRATSNEKCIQCHSGLSHFANADGSPVTVNTETSCASCHREHQGAEGLAIVGDRHCTGCHSNLNTENNFTKTVAARITSFDPEDPDDAHPEFAVCSLSKNTQRPEPPGKNHAVFTVLGSEDEARPTNWVDRARIDFNHKRHLHAVYENGELVEGLLDANRRPTDFSHNCSHCHELDAERRYMLPVNYEKHCSSCHRLYYDAGDVSGPPGAANEPANRPLPVVPHEKPEIVRGFLTNVFMERIGRQISAEEESRPETTLPDPGRPQLNREQQQRVQRLVTDAESRLLREYEKSIRKNEHKFFGIEAGGGCRFCHEVNLSGSGVSANWTIVPPEIPERWMPYSKFSHFSHRNLSCVHCHEKVYDSDKTSDVLMTSIETCRKCHTAKVKGRTPESVGARAHCVECHDYHKHHSSEWTAPPRETK